MLSDQAARVPKGMITTFDSCPDLCISPDLCILPPSILYSHKAHHIQNWTCHLHSFQACSFTHNYEDKNKLLPLYCSRNYINPKSLPGISAHWKTLPPSFLVSQLPRTMSRCSIFSPTFYYETFKYKKVESIYKENLYTYHRDSTIKILLYLLWASLVAQLVKNPPAVQETPAWFLGGEDPLEEG